MSERRSAPSQFERIERALTHLVERSGATLIVLSPGSRSTPLVLAAERAGVRGIATHDVIDERAAGFFALGHARVTGVPAPLVCTSGTALAHYLPAVIEAYRTHTPMIILSADRPPELHGCGANQTIPQQGIFGRFVVAEGELGLELTMEETDALCARIADASRTGPVHLNVPARKPLEPALDVAPLLTASERVGGARAPAQLDAAVVDDLEGSLAAFSSARHGLIVSGPLGLHEAHGVREAVRRLVTRTGFTLCAETTSQLRHGVGPAQVSCLDALGRSAAGRRLLRDSPILQIGQAPIAKGYELLLGEHRAPRVVLAPHGHPDPTRSATAVHTGPLCQLIDAVAARWPAEPPVEAQAWPSSSSLHEAERLYQTLRDELLASPSLTEAQVADVTSQVLSERDLWFVGNSLTVRNVDAWTPLGYQAYGILHQRGVSGIDGNLAGACGAAAACAKSAGAVIASVGDVTALHDVGGLATYQGGTLVVIVVHNGGGRIFEQLPIAARPGAPMRHFATEHGVDFSNAAALYGVAFSRALDRDGLRDAIDEAKRRGGPTLIEARVPAHDATERNRTLWTRFDEQLRVQVGRS